MLLQIKKMLLQIKKDVAANKKSPLRIKKQLLYLIYTLVPSLTLFKLRVKTLDGGCHVLFSLWEGSQRRIKVLLSLWLFPTAVEYSSRVYHLEYQSSTIYNENSQANHYRETNYLRLR